MNIWFNHWFSSVYFIIKLVKENEPDFHVIGTNENAESVMNAVCDEFYVEPKIPASEYVDFCLGFCRKHDIHVFVPRRNQILICKEIEKFHQQGIKVLAEPDYRKVEILQDKRKCYEMLRGSFNDYVPDFRIVTNVKEFEAAYHDLKTEENRVCFKAVEDEGGTSFRVIDDRVNGFLGLFMESGKKVSYERAVKGLSEKNTFHELMVMKYLSGAEVSVDCLMTRKGLILVPRYKTYGRVEYIKFDEKILKICQDFYDLLDIKTPCNIQFKYDKDIPYFLEINTRMSGGIQRSCLAAGVNIPNIAVNQLLGIEKEWNMMRKERKVSFVETPIIVE